MTTPTRCQIELGQQVRGESAPNPPRYTVEGSGAPEATIVARSPEAGLAELKIKLNEQALKFRDDFRARLDEINDPTAFADWLLRYDAFNRGFPGAAASLAGRIAVQTDLFGDLPAEAAASRVLAAITDEFMDRSSGEIALHSSLRRELALACIEKLSGKSRADILPVVRAYDPFRKALIQRTQVGYGLFNPNDLDGIFSGLGFFTASETSGSYEFVTLNGVMARNWPELTEGLQGRTDESGRELYGWVTDHEDLEANHAVFAFSAVEQAVRALSDARTVDEALILTRQGVSEFFAMAEETLLTDEPIPSELRDLMRS